VDRSRLEKKLPVLLISQDTSSPEGFNEYRRTEYRLQQMKKKQPAKYQALLNAVAKPLEALKGEVLISWGPTAVIKEEERLRKAPAV
jgi:hypothetical protein